MSSESLRTHLDRETTAALTEYAENHDIAATEAIKELVHTGLASHRQGSSQPADENHPPHSELERRQRLIADQQRQIVRFQKHTVFGGVGWALLTLLTGANGVIWIAIGMLLIVLMASSTYIWQYLPTIQ